MKSDRRNVLWFSSGVSSAVCWMISRSEIDEAIYIDILDQHPDSLRFNMDLESKIGKKLSVLRSEYESVNDVCLAFRFINGPRGARCTDVLKRRPRKDWEGYQDSKLVYFWGLDVSEKKRADRIVESMPESDHRFPLIERGISKEDAHGILARAGIKRPAMYDLGYQNNNCLGCVKGGRGYWNKIRRDFPQVFKMRSEMERRIGRSCLNGCFLDELDPESGREEKEISTECGVMCMIYSQNG